MLLVIDVIKVMTVVGWVSLAIIVFFIFYRILLQRMKRSVMLQDKYIRLDPFEGEKAVGEVQFFFTAEEEKQVQFRIYDKKGEQEMVLKDEVVKKGGHVVNFDSTKLPNGIYFYEIKTPNQKTSKVIEIAT
jgi:amino acid permease